MALVKRLACLLLIACGGEGVVLGPTEKARRETCFERRDARAAAATPLFQAGPALTSPVVSRMNDVIVTEVGFRFRPARERANDFGNYLPNTFAGRSARLRIEDFVAAGRSEVKVTLTTELDFSTNGPRVQFRAFRQVMAGGVTTSNVTMTPLSARVAERRVVDNSRSQRALQAGDVLDFDLELFFAGFDAADPNPIVGDPHAYSDTFRYRIGRGGLDAEPFDDDAPRAVGPSALLGGGLTVPFFTNGGTTAWNQLGLQTAASQTNAFLNGRRRAFSDVETGTHEESGNPPLATVPVDSNFNARRCTTCHRNSGRGALTTIAMFSDGPLGPVVQRTEHAATLTEVRTVRTEVVGGSVVTLTVPVFDSGSPRIASALAGSGLLEAVSSSTLLSHADEDDCDGDGISGRPGNGRFGWKATHKTLDELIRFETKEHLGAQLDDTSHSELISFVRLLGVPVQRGGPSVARGEAVFSEVRCNQCHLTSLITSDTHPLDELRMQTIRPFTDLLLHDLGPALSDGTDSKQAREWRTAPLWGLGVARVVHGEQHLLHDGRARTPLEAILWHDGEARTSADLVRKLSTSDVDALVAFLDSL